MSKINATNDEVRQLLHLLKRYTANDHVHGGCDELTEEAEDLIELIESEGL